MLSIRNLLKVLASTMLPVVLLIGVVGWAERARPFAQRGNAPAVSTPALDPYPLPGQPSAPKATATPGRLNPYPFPGSPSKPTPTSTASKGAPPLSVVTTTLTPVLWLPLIRNDCYFKGTASVANDVVEGNLRYSNTLTMGVCAGYEWNHAYTPTHPAYWRPWQVINNVRSRNYSDGSTTFVITWNISIDGGICPGARGYSPTINVYDPLPDGQAALRACVQTIAASRPGLYWLIWNEPDDGDQDNFSPAQGAHFFREISNTILGGDPTARLIVGNVLNRYHSNPTHGCPAPPKTPAYGCGEYWLTQFISEAEALGYDPRPHIAGYGFHVYSFFTYSPPSPCIGRPPEDSCHDVPLIESFTSTVITFANWVNAHDAGKETWLSEINWYPLLPWEDWDTQLRRMSGICSTLTTLPIERYFWFYGGWPWSSGYITNSLFADQSGVLSPAGERFGSPAMPPAGGCPAFR